MTDGDGAVTSVELGHIVRTLGYKPSNNELSDLINNSSLIKNKSNITFLDIQNILPQLQSIDSEQTLHDAISVFDRDSNGLITISELRNIFTTLGEPINSNELDILLNQLKTDENGKVKLLDFIKAIYK